MGVTIKDVAEAAGVSISTVSKVLNGHYSISEKTAQRVRGIMREMNYYPNANAQSFASGSNHTVVLLANLAPNAAFQNPHMFEIISGLEEALCKRGYRLILRGADATSACGIAEEIISRRSADAIAVHVVPPCRSRGCHVPSSGRRADPAAISPHRSGRTGL